MVHEALRAADRLSQEGIECEVVDPRTLDPLDEETILASVARTRRAVVVEEGWRNVGVGAEIAARMQEHLFHQLDAPVQRVAAANVPTPYAKGLEQSALPHAADIVRAVLKITT
jgi:pyruvate dehydrogenase E1 component beta subunit